MPVSHPQEPPTEHDQAGQRDACFDRAHSEAATGLPAGGVVEDVGPEGAQAVLGGVADVTPPVEAALFVTGAPDVTNRAIRECNETDIRNIWIYKIMPFEDDCEHAAEFARMQGAAVIEGYCPMMFLPRPAFVHRAHRVFIKLWGSHPL